MNAVYGQTKRVSRSELVERLGRDVEDEILLVNRQSGQSPAKVRLGHLGGFHLDRVTGGVQALEIVDRIFAYMSCANIPEDQYVAHGCGHGPAPHRIKVHVAGAEHEVVWEALCEALDYDPLTKVEAWETLRQLWGTEEEQAEVRLTVSPFEGVGDQGMKLWPDLLGPAYLDNQEGMIGGEYQFEADWEKLRESERWEELPDLTSSLDAKRSAPDRELSREKANKIQAAAAQLPSREVWELWLQARGHTLGGQDD